MIQWLRIHIPNAGGTGLIPGWETKIPHSAQCDQKDKKKKKKGKNTILSIWKSELF